MANIFSGTEAPRWIWEQGRDAGEKGAQLGQLAGTALSAGMLAMRENPDAKPDPETGKRPKLGFGEAWRQTRLNQADPMWKLKEQEARANMASEMAQATSAMALATEREHESRSWMEDVNNGLAQWLVNPSTDGSVPKFQSKTANALLPRALASSKVGQINLNAAKAFESDVNKLSGMGPAGAQAAADFGPWVGQPAPPEVREKLAEVMNRIAAEQVKTLEQLGPATSAKTTSKGTEFSYDAPRIDAETAAKEKLEAVKSASRMKETAMRQESDMEKERFKAAEAMKRLEVGIAAKEKAGTKLSLFEMKAKNLQRAVQKAQDLVLELGMETDPDDEDLLRAKETQIQLETRFQNHFRDRDKATSPTSAPSNARPEKKLTRDQAQRYLDMAEGDPEAARDLAKSDGFTF